MHILLDIVISRALKVCFKRVYFLKAHRDNTWTHTHWYCSPRTHTHSTILGPHCVCKQPFCLEGVIHLMFTSSAIVADGVKCPSGVFILSWGVQTADWPRQTRPDTWAPLLSLFTANLLVSHWDSLNIEWPQFPFREKKGLGRERTREQINKKRLLSQKQEVSEMAGTVNDSQVAQVG